MKIHQNSSTAQHQWVVVTDAGTDQESIHNDYPSFENAKVGMKKLGYQSGDADIMKRLNDSTLTTEF